MKVLVTGANGYLGQGVVRALCDYGVDVVATDFSGEYIDTRATTITGDLFSIENPYDYFEQPSVVLHMAWRNGFLHNAATHLGDLPQHYDFLHKLIDGGISQIAVMGSMHEVGFWEGCIKEDTPCNPMNLYGIAKNALRQSLQLLCEENGTCFQWLRAFYIVGNNACGSSIFSKIFKADSEGQAHFPFTMGQNQYDFIEYSAFCEQVAAAIMQKDIRGIINIGSGKPEKLAERVERFIKDNGLKISLQYGVYPDRKYDSKAVWGDSAKMEKILEGKQSL